MDALSPFDPILNRPDREVSNPWRLVDDDVQYVPDLALLCELIAVAAAAGGLNDNTGSLANAIDAWIADEFRRAGFGENEVWPRRREPRVVEPAIAEFEKHLAAIEQDILEKESRRSDPEEVMMKSLRKRIFALRNKLPGSVSAHALGRFYNKQIDVMASHIERGPLLRGCR